MSDPGNPPGSPPKAGPGALAPRPSGPKPAVGAGSTAARPSGPKAAPVGTRPTSAQAPALGQAAPPPTGSRPALGQVAPSPTGSRAAAAAPSLASAPPRPSQAGVMSAARIKEHPTDLKQKLKAGAEDTALNLVGMLRDGLRDFTRASVYFKYKVLIAGLWLLLTTSTFVVACPSNPLAASSDLGARLVIANSGGRPVYMVKNESDEAWKNVVLVVNQQYRAASAEVAAGANFTVTPKQLVGANSALAPPDLVARDIELRTDDGNDVLLKDGEPQ